MLRLEGVLQSWGEDAKWDMRGSADMPSKSGIIGLLACAMGLERGDLQIAAMAQAVTIAVRADRPGVRMTDYHTVTGTPLLNAARKPRSSGNTLVSRRQYLQDASFLAVLQTDETWLERFVQALNTPKWCIYLGRKSCVPSRPIFEGVHTEYINLWDALERYPAAERTQYPLYCECDVERPGAGNYTRTDMIFSSDRQFSRRCVWYGTVGEAKDVSDKN